MAYLGTLGALSLLGLIECILNFVDLFGSEECAVVLVQLPGLGGDLRDEVCIALSAGITGSRCGISQSHCEIGDRRILLVHFHFARTKGSLHILGLLFQITVL